MDYDFSEGTLPIARYAVDRLLRDADINHAGNAGMRTHGDNVERLGEFGFFHCPPAQRLISAAPTGQVIFRRAGL